MATDHTSTGMHPVTVRVGRLRGELAELLALPLWSMGQAETGTTLSEITRLGAQVAALEARVVAHAQSVEVEAPSGATSTAVWWAHQTRITRSEAFARTRLAEALGRHERTADALAAGDLVTEQATVIIRAIEDLPTDLATEQKTEAETWLLDQARHHDAKALRILGRRILEVIDPETAEAREAALLAKEEAEAAASARFTMAEDGHGRVHGRFTLPALQGGMLKKALLAFAAPKHVAAVDGHAPVERRPSPERLGRALMEYVERYPVDRLPDAGGLAATVVVTMGLETLLGGLKAATVDTGEVLSPGQARRLACEAGLIPMVLGGASQALDVGREQRFHPKYQRIAITVRDQHCTARGCDVPASLCHIHHDTPWSEGGDTNVEDGRLLCPRHHTHAHDPTYEMRRHPDGTVTFHRRTHGE